MRFGIPTLVCVAGLVVQASAGDAETWTILSGTLIKGGATSSLSGSFTGSVSAADSQDEPALLAIDDFSLVAGRRTLEPDLPVEYQGLSPAGWLSAADQILLEGDQVTFVHLRTGGKQVGGGLGYATFRFLELRADASHGGFAKGGVPDSDAPRRLALKGDVYQVDQSFQLPPPCPPGTPQPLPGGGGAAAGGSVTVVSTGGFGRREFVWVGDAPDPSGVLNRVNGSGGTISGSLHEGGTIVIAGPAMGSLVTSTVGQPVSAAGAAAAAASLTSNHVVLTSNHVVLPMSVAPAPTLEQLGIRAPDGAEISLDEHGALLVSSTGDLFVEGTLPESPIEGLTSVTLYTRARIIVTGRIVLPGISLRLDGGAVFSGGEIDAGNPDAQPPACRGLTPILPAPERLIGQFSLVASAARQMQIDVMPGDKRNRVFQNVLRAPIGVAILGSRSLDVTDVDLDTLRLGTGEAEPNRPDLSLPHFPQSPSFPATPLVMPVNRDRFSDLLAFYPLPDAEIAYGDTELCLVAQTHDGELLEGCDRIDTVSGFPAVR